MVFVFLGFLVLFFFILAVCPLEWPRVTLTTGDFLMDKNTMNKSKINFASYTSFNNGQCHTAKGPRSWDLAPIKIIFIQYCHSSNSRWNKGCNRKHLHFFWKTIRFITICHFLHLIHFALFIQEKALTHFILIQITRYAIFIISKLYVVVSNINKSLLIVFTKETWMELNTYYFIKNIDIYHFTVPHNSFHWWILSESLFQYRFTLKNVFR